MDSIAHEIIPYLTTIIGFLIVYVLNGIKGEIKEVKVGVNALEKDLRETVATLDRRITVVETRCSVEHNHE